MCYSNSQYYSIYNATLAPHEPPKSPVLRELPNEPMVPGPMRRAQEIAEVSPGIFVWQAYDGKVKAELFSTALETHSGPCVVDPIPLATEGLLLLRARYPQTAGIFVTNANHARAATDFAGTFSAPLYVHGELRGNPDFAEATGV